MLSSAYPVGSSTHDCFARSTITAATIATRHLGIVDSNRFYGGSSKTMSQGSSTVLYHLSTYGHARSSPQ
jgi:hypothetical protein